MIERIVELKSMYAPVSINGVKSWLIDTVSKQDVLDIVGIDEGEKLDDEDMALIAEEMADCRDYSEDLNYYVNQRLENKKGLEDSSDRPLTNLRN